MVGGQREKRGDEEIMGVAVVGRARSVGHSKRVVLRQSLPIQRMVKTRENKLLLQVA